MADDLTLKVTLTGDGRRLSGTLRDAQGEVRQFGITTERENGRASRSLDTTSRSANRVNSSLSEMKRVGDLARNTLVALGGAMSVREVIQYADAWTNASNQLRQAADGNAQLALMQQRVVDLAKETRSSFESTATLYARLHRSTTELSISQHELLDLVRTINQSFALSGASAAEASGAIFQLSQGLASGALRGEEFNSVAEQAPILLKSIADYLDMTTGELRAFASQGGITADIVVQALQRSADTINNEFGESIASFGQKMEISRTNLIAWVGTSDEVSGSVDLLGDSVVLLTENLDGLVTIGTVLAGLYAGRLAGGIAATTAAKLAATQQAIAYQSALARMAGVSRTAAAATGALRGALAFLGGPIGLLIGVGGLLYTFREELGLTQHQIGLTTSELSDFNNKLDEMSNKDLGQSIESLNLQLEEATLKAAAAREELAKLQAEDDGYSITGIGNLGDQVAGINALGEAQENLREIEQKLAAARQEEGARSYQTLDQWLFKVNDSASHLSDTQTEAAKAAEQYDNNLQSLIDTLYPLEKSQREYQQSVDLLTTAYMRGDISQQRYLDGLDKIDQQFQNASDWAEVYGLNVETATQQAADAVDPMVTAIERGVERMDDSFVDFWENTLSGAENTFDSFKDLAISTLAEIIHAYTTRQITASLSATISGGAAGGQSSGMGGMGDLASIGKQVYSGVVDGFGAINWTGAPTSYSGGWAGSATAGMNTGGSFLSNGSMSNFSGMQGLAALPASMAGSYVGNTVGESLTGKQANSNIGATAGAAIGTFFGGPIGAFAGSAIGGLLDSAFGSAGPELDLALQRGNAASYETGDWDHGLRAQSALGTVGFNGKNSHDINATWGEDNAQNALDAIAQLDNVLASLAETPEQLQQMTDAVMAPKRDGIQGYYGETSTPSVAVETLTSRYKDAIDSLDLALEDTILGIDSGAQDLVSTATSLNAFEDLVGDNTQALADARDALADSDDLVATAQALASQAQAMASLSDAAERLNLTFDETSSGALSAAGSMAALVGGVDTLASLQQRYYQTFTTGQERFEDLTQDLSEQFGELGYSLPTTRDGFKRLVEAQDLMTASGRRTYAALLQLAPAMADYIEGVEQFTDTFDELLASASNARSVVEQAYAGFSNTAFEQQITLLELAGRGTEALALQRQKELATLDEALRPTQERIWQLQDEAAAMDDYTNALSQANSFLESALDNIAAFVDESLATSGSPTENLQTTQEQFARQLVLAESGDRNALQSITQYADRYLQAAEAYYASGIQAQRIEDDVLGALQELPELLSPEDYIADNIRQALEDSQNLGALPGIEELADEQLAELGSLVDEMTRTTDQFVGLNATMVSLQDSINALGVAQEEIARIEREQAAAEKAERERLAQERAAAAERAEIGERRSELEGLIDDREAIIERNSPLAEQYGQRADDTRQGYWSYTYLNYLDEQAQTRAGDWDAMDAFVEMQKDQGNRASASYFYNLVREYTYGNSVSEAQSAIEQAEKELGSLPAFASGGLHSGGWALVGEEGPELVNMGPSRIYDAETTQGMLGGSATLPPVIAPPMGASGGNEPLAALLRENNRLMRENGELLKRLDAHGAAAVKVAQAGHSQSIEVQKRSAQSLETMERKARMEALS